MKKGGELAEVAEVCGDLEDAWELLEERDEVALAGEVEVAAGAAAVAGAHHAVSIGAKEPMSLDWRGGVDRPRFAQRRT
jgi:hypothetical protein